jgi:hypothetical protein
MANELLDFVMSLVRDPDAAARYADNPQQAIADAHLTDVTSVDVNNLIPVVSESLSMAAPTFGVDAAGDPNVWASGAATAAFDAFADHPPVPTFVDSHDFVLDQPPVVQSGSVVDQFANPVDDLHSYDLPTVDPPFAGAETVDVHDVAAALDPVVDHGFDAHHGLSDPGAAPDAPGFDTPLF